MILILCAILTYVLPAGSYDRVENEDGRMLLVADSYHEVEPNPISLKDFLAAVPMGLEAQAALIFFVFVCGGTFGVFDETNALNVGINKIAHKLQGRENIMIIVITAIFSILGATMAFDPQVIMFIPLGVALARKCGYDAVTGIGMVLGGVYIGFSCGALNPYTTAVAQGIAGVPLFSGAGFRIIWQIVTLIAVCFYIIRYANKVKADPTKSYCYDLELQEKGENGFAEQQPDVNFTVRQVLVVLTLIIGLGIVVYGSLKLSWGTTDMSAIFLGMGIVAGILGGLGGNKICNACLGAGNVAYEKWVRFAMPMFLIETGIAIVFVIIASIMGF